MNSLKSEHYASVLPYPQCIRVLKVIRIKIICCSVTQSCPTLCDPMDCSTPGFPVLHCLRRLLRLRSTELVMPSNHFILCHPLLLQPSIFPSIRVFSNESALCLKWLNYWSFSFGISPSNEYSGLISFRMGWFDLLAFQGAFKSLLKHHSSKHQFLQCSAFFMVQLSHPHMTTRKTRAFHFLPLSKCKGESIILRVENLLMGNDTAS